MDQIGKKEPLTNRSRLSRGGRVLLLALVGLLLAATAGVAASGALDVGDVIPGGDPAGAPANRLNVQQTILATGVSTIAGPWQITSYKSEGVTQNGEVVEPAGLPCIRLVLSEPPEGTPLLGSGFCGTVGEGGFNVADVPVKGDGGRIEVILFGQAPERATAVQVTASDGKSISAQTQEGPADYPGDLWAVSVPPELRSPEITWVGDTPGAASARIDASRYLDRGKYLAQAAQ